MAESEAYYLEVRTKDKHRMLLALSGQLRDLITDCADWMRENDLVPEEIDYAKICRCRDYGWVASLVWEDGTVFLEPRKVRGGYLGILWRRALFHLKAARLAGDIPF